MLRLMLSVLTLTSMNSDFGRRKSERLIVRVMKRPWLVMEGWCVFEIYFSAVSLLSGG